MRCSDCELIPGAIYYSKLFVNFSLFLLAVGGGDNAQLFMRRTIVLGRNVGVKPSIMGTQGKSSTKKDTKQEKILNNGEFVILRRKKRKHKYFLLQQTLGRNRS